MISKLKEDQTALHLVREKGNLLHELLLAPYAFVALQKCPEHICTTPHPSD